MSKEKTSLVFTGDIGFDHYMDHKWEDKELISDEILAFLNDADHVIANIEGPVCDLAMQPLENSVLDMMHTIDPAAESVFKKMNADIWNINNNHIMDAGEAGVLATIKEAQKCGALTLGAGKNIDDASKPLILDDAGGIGMISVGYRRGCKPADTDKAGCFLWNEMELIEKRIKEIKEKCRWCIVISHGGEEFTSLPNPYTRERYLEYLNMGADIIVCHHPHVPMNYEKVGDKIIFYSLGNFIFDTNYQRAQFNTEKGVVLRLDILKDDYSFEAMGINIDRENERIVKADLPDIFTDVPADEYEKLHPLAAKMFIAATKRQQIYLNPEKFKNATEDEWREHFYEEKRSGRVIGEALDFQIIYPLAEKEKEGAWKESRLDKVVDYILAQM